MSGKDFGRRLERLETGQKRDASGERDENLTAPERAWRKGLRLAPAEEYEELSDLFEHIKAEGREPDYGRDGRFFELYERVMRRSAPTLANTVRRHRDGLWRALDGLYREAGGYVRPNGPEDWARVHAVPLWLGQAHASRMHAVEHRRAPLITDASEIAGILEQLRGQPPEKVEVIVGLARPEG